MRLSDIKQKMGKVLDKQRYDFSCIRTGRVHLGVFEKIVVDAQSVQLTLKQIGVLSVTSADMIEIKPWDKTMIQSIHKAVNKFDAQLRCMDHGDTIRIKIPPLTLERQKEIIQSLKKNAEEYKIFIRNIRREAVEYFLKMEKAKEISKDECRRNEKSIQKLTNDYIGQLDQRFEVKTKEISIV